MKMKSAHTLLICALLVTVSITVVHGQENSSTLSSLPLFDRGFFTEAAKGRWSQLEQAVRLFTHSILARRTRTHTHTHAHTSAHVFTHTRTHSRACTDSHTHKDVHTSSHTRTYARTHTYMHTFAHACNQIFTDPACAAPLNTHLHTFMQVYAHTHRCLSATPHPPHTHTNAAHRPFGKL